MFPQSQTPPEEISSLQKDNSHSNQHHIERPSYIQVPSIHLVPSSPQQRSSSAPPQRESFSPSTFIPATISVPQSPSQILNPTSTEQESADSFDQYQSDSEVAPQLTTSASVDNSASMSKYSTSSQSSCYSSSSSQQYIMRSPSPGSQSQLSQVSPGFIYVMIPLSSLLFWFIFSILTSIFLFSVLDDNAFSR